ncbi:MAG: PEP-CTERM sorting domain-containing protein [Bryobacterales bacterium]|nr:PEP-CTERM sorting domain-containing protein [Bryobacterales bacterium]
MIRKPLAVATLCIAALSSSAAIGAAVDSLSSSLPPVGGQYVADHLCYFGGAFCASDLVFTGFANAASSFGGLGQHVTFDTHMYANVAIPGYSGPVVFSGSMGLLIFGRTSDSHTGVFAAEMLSLHLTDPFGAIVRESPTLTSSGVTSITTIPGGFHISSFFDIFPVLSIDGEQSWIPEDGGPGGPVHLTLTPTPEPSGLMLLISGAGVLAIVRRKRRAIR